LFLSGSCAFRVCRKYDYGFLEIEKSILSFPQRLSGTYFGGRNSAASPPGHRRTLGYRIDHKKHEKRADQTIFGSSLKNLVSTQTGRRYACVHQKSSRRLAAYRLDSIRNVILLEPDSDFQAYEDALAAHLPHVWGVSFGSKRKPEQVCLRIRLNEADEPHIINRLEREGRHGTLKRLEPGLYEYTNTCWDAAELLPWIKSFTGRIVSFTCSNPGVEKRLWDDIRLMGQLYENQPGPQSPGKNPAEHGNKEGENILK